MYRNIGGKIKGLAKLFCTLGIIFSVLIGLVLCAAGFMSGSGAAITACVIGAIIYILLGILFAWLSTIMLYAFGQQVEMQEKSAVLLEKILNKMNNAPQPVAAPVSKAVEPAAPRFEAPNPTCPKCGASITEGAAFCTNCGNKM